MLRPLAALLLLCSATLARAEDADRYQDCMGLARTEPERGYETAMAWLALGGGPAAQHCAAVALIGRGDAIGAAGRLERLAAERPDWALRPQVLGQAGQAWLIAGQPERARAAYDAALEARPDDPELLLDRALALAELGRYDLALADLDRSLAGRPDRAEALALRASAHRRLGDIAAADRDVARAIALAPALPEALLERGRLRLLHGDLRGARLDWVAVVQQAPDGAAAEAAQRNIEELELGGKAR